MKQSLFGKKIKQTFLAVPAAAMMLGVSQAQTTIGINFQAWYYDSGTTPQTVGYGGGYQTTGFPATARAFGVDVANWYNTDPLTGGDNGVGIPISQYATFNGVTNFDGTLNAYVTAPDAWESGIGEQNIGFQATPALPETVAPGNNEVTWGYLDDGGGGGSGIVPSVSISGLAAKFPNGYVIETIAAEANVAKFAGVNITDGITTNTLSYATYYVTNPINDGYDLGGTVGLSVSSGVFTSDTIYINCQTNTSGTRSTLAGFIITDQPVISQPVASITNYDGQTLILNSGAFGLAPMSYQWQLNGVPIPGATAATYTNTLVTFTNAGSYSVVVSNPYGASSNLITTLSVMPLTLQLTNGNVIQDTKPAGTPDAGYNQGTTWLASSVDLNSVTRNGVEQFVQTNNSQITIPYDPNLNTTNGTICFWMNYNSAFGFPGAGAEAAILFDDRTTQGAVVGVNTVNGTIEFQGDGGGPRFTNSDYVVDGNWHHVAITYDQGTNGVVSVYVDGNLDTSLANSTNWSWPTNVPVELGRSRDTYWKIYNGQMDDFRMYNQILTQTQIQQIVAGDDSNLVATGLLVRYNFNSDSASYGSSLVWPYGNLISSPVLGSGAVWMPVSGVSSPTPFLPSPSLPAVFYRVINAP